jgi:hypothetical protein
MLIQHHFGGPIVPGAMVPGRRGTGSTLGQCGSVPRRPPVGSRPQGSRPQGPRPRGPRPQGPRPSKGSS